MKKIIILLTSGFIFCILFALMMIALFTNTWGININDVGLFPHIEISALNDPAFNSNRTYQDIYLEGSLNHFYIQNNTGHNLNVNYNKTSFDAKGDEFFVSVYSPSSYFIDYSDQVFTISNIPTDYEYYFSLGYIYRTQDESGIYVSNDEYINGEANYEDDTTSSEFTIKDGEKYEIKLS